MLLTQLSSLLLLILYYQFWLVDIIFRLYTFSKRTIAIVYTVLKRQLYYKSQHYIFKKGKIHNEFPFAQLCNQFISYINYAKSFETGILSKISALNVVQNINKLIFDRNITNIKISIINV